MSKKVPKTKHYYYIDSCGPNYYQFMAYDIDNNYMRFGRVFSDATIFDSKLEFLFMCKHMLKREQGFKMYLVRVDLMKKIRSQIRIHKHHEYILRFYNHDEVKIDYDTYRNEIDINAPEGIMYHEII